MPRPVMSRETIAALGWALTATIWLLAGLMMLSAVAGQCAAATSIACPNSGSAAFVAVAWIVVGAVTLNALVFGLVAYLRRR